MQWNPTPLVRITLYVRWNRWMFGVEWGRWDFGLEHYVLFSLGPVDLSFRREIIRVAKYRPLFDWRSKQDRIFPDFDAAADQVIRGMVKKRLDEMAEEARNESS